MQALTLLFIFLSLIFIGYVNYKVAIKKGNKLIHTYGRYLHEISK
jgi:hypothetical protein